MNLSDIRISKNNREHAVEGNEESGFKKKQKYIMKFSEETKLFSIQNRDTAIAVDNFTFEKLQ